LSSTELTEIGLLFRAKLRQLREQERTRVAATRRRPIPARQYTRLHAIESPPGDHDVLSPGDVARLLSVDPKTVSRWATNDGLRSFRTLGGHRRFRWADVKRWLQRVDAATP
jgi:excisionase family DNA binding protein